MFIENIVEEPAPPTQSQEPAADKVSPKQAVPLINAAMDKIEQEGEWFTLSALGTHIMAANSDFDTRTYGFKKLSDLVNNLSQFELQKTGNALSVRHVKTAKKTT